MAYALVVVDGAPVVDAVRRRRGIEVDADWLRVGILRLRLFFALFAQRTILAQDDNLN